MPITIGHNLTATTPDNTAYEIRPSHWNDTHAATLNISATEISGLFSNANGVSFGLSNDKITASVAAGGGGLTNIRVSAGTTSNLLSALTFADGNGITFGLNASTLTASHNGLTSQSAQAFSAVGGASTFQTLSFNNANGITFSNNNGSVQASHTAPVVSNAIQAVGSASGSGTNTSRFAADDHVHPGVFSMGVSNVGNTAGNTRVDAGRFVLAGGNGVTLSQATAVNALNTISVSVANQSNQQMTLYATGNTTQSSTGTQNASSLLFRGEGVASVGVTNGSVVISVPSGGGAGDGGNTVVAGTRTASSSAALFFSDSNGISWGLNANNGQTLTASFSRNVASNAIQAVGSATGSGTNTSRFAADDHVHAGVFSMGVSTGGNTVGDTRVDAGRFVLQGGNNVTLSQITAANALNTIVVSAGAGGGGETRLTAYAVSNTTQSSSGTIPLSQLSFHGAGIASVGVSNGSVIISVPSGGGAGFEAGASNIGDTFGTTGTVNGRLVFVGSNGIALSQSVNGGSATLSISPEIANGYYGLPVASASTVSVRNGTLALLPFALNAPVAISYVAIPATCSVSSSSNSSHAGAMSLSIAFYTKNAETLSLVASASTAYQWTNTSSNSNSILSGLREMVIPFSTTLTAGEYWVGFHPRSSTTNANWFSASFFVPHPGLLSNAWQGPFMGVSNTTLGFVKGFGEYTASFSTAMPDSVALSHVSAIGVQLRSYMFNLKTFT